ncbi:hypothetical protein JZ751_004180 [Albula glossodonta]|uniref:Proline-rich protein 5-like n=1 Tax=Albula glossodonta TaxID=121402 RepID=A0A8T2NAG7_9TELE|nr:hypothetical protein JZ751_004180 [Albula glossodonta]
MPGCFSKIHNGVVVDRESRRLALSGHQRNRRVDRITAGRRDGFVPAPAAPLYELAGADGPPSVQSAVIKVFQGGGLQPNELYSLNESIRWLLKTELGSFITEYFQNQLLGKGLMYIIEKIQLYEGACNRPQPSLCIHNITFTWAQCVQNSSVPPDLCCGVTRQGQELTVRQMALLGFRDLVLLKLSLEELLPVAPPPPPPAITQMLLVLQGIHEPSGPSPEYCQLEKLVEMVVSPYLGNYIHRSHTACYIECRAARSRAHFGQPEILVTQHAGDSCSLAPLVEQEGEAYLEKVGGVRRHTVANAHSDLQLLSVANMMHQGALGDDCGGGGAGNGGGVGAGAGNGICVRSRPFSSQPHILDPPVSVTMVTRKQGSADLGCAPPS